MPVAIRHAQLPQDNIRILTLLSRVRNVTNFTTLIPGAKEQENQQRSDKCCGVQENNWLSLPIHNDGRVV